MADWAGVAKAPPWLGIPERQTYAGQPGPYANINDQMADAMKQNGLIPGGEQNPFLDNQVPRYAYGFGLLNSTPHPTGGGYYGSGGWFQRGQPTPLGNSPPPPLTGGYSYPTGGNLPTNGGRPNITNGLIPGGMGGGGGGDIAPGAPPGNGPIPPDVSIPRPSPNGAPGGMRTSTPTGGLITGTPVNNPLQRQSTPFGNGQPVPQSPNGDKGGLSKTGLLSAQPQPPMGPQSASQNASGTDMASRMAVFNANPQWTPQQQVAYATQPGNSDLFNQLVSSNPQFAAMFNDASNGYRPGPAALGVPVVMKGY